VSETNGNTNARLTLYNSPKLQGLLGISEENAYRILHAHGIRIGGLYFITQERLEIVLNVVKEVPIDGRTKEERRRASHTRPYVHHNKAITK